MNIFRRLLLCTLLFTALTQPVHALKEVMTSIVKGINDATLDWNRHDRDNGRHIQNYKDTRAAWASITSQNKVREVLYATYGADNWYDHTSSMNEATKNALQEAAPGITITADDIKAGDALDITTKIRGMLASDGRLYTHWDNTTPEQITDLSSAQIKERVSTGYNGRDTHGIGVFYRDNNDVHYARFEPYTEIMLPAISSWFHDHNGRGSEGGYFISSQLPEPSRGLITFTVQGINRDLYISFDSRWKLNWGPSYKHAPRHYQLFWWVWGGWSGNKSCWGGNGADTFKHFDRNGAQKIYRTQKYSDHLQSISFPGPRDDQAIDLWMALDKGTFKVGTGRPTSIDDLDKNGNMVVTTQNPAGQMFDQLRFFALSNGHGDDGQFSNVRTFYLDPTRKFDTPPFMAYHFTHWRDGWELPNRSNSSLTFKARGKDIAIALNKEKIMSGDYSAARPDYVLAVDNSDVVLLKNGTKMAVTKHRSPGQILAGTDLERYYDYWISHNQGRIAFGHGTTVGQNIVVEFEDTKIKAEADQPGFFSFSCYDKPTDYTNIYAEEFYQVTTAQTANSYDWATATRFAQDNLSSIVFDVRFAPNTQNASVKIGFAAAPSAGAFPADLSPTHEAVFGAQNNTAGEVIHLSQMVSEQKDIGSDGIALASLDVADPAWQTLWVSYADGMVSYGKGNIVGSQTIDSWPGPSDQVINAFAITAGSTSTEFRNIRQQSATSSRSYTTRPNQNMLYEQWSGGWRLGAANKGAFTFTADATNLLQIGLAPNGSSTAQTAAYDIIVNDDGKMYVRRNRSKIESSIIALPATVSGTQQYWVTFIEGTIRLGIGPLDKITDAATELLRWTDDTFDRTTTQITRFSFSGKTAAITYRDISPGTGTDLVRRIDSMVAAAGQRETIEAQWQTDTTSQTITKAHANEFWWHEDRRFAQDNKTSFSCGITKKGSEPLTALVGFGNSVENAFGQAEYKLALNTDAGTLVLHRGSTKIAETTERIESITSLGDGRMHTLWVNYDNGALSLGIDAATGSNAIWSFTDPKPAPLVRYAAVSTTGSEVTFSALTLTEFYNPSVLTTAGNRTYVWKPEWAFSRDNRGTVAFEVLSDNKFLILSIGLGNSATVNENPSDEYNGALYNLEIEYNGKIFIREKNGLDVKIKNNDIRYGSGDPRHIALTSLATSTTPVPCSLVYDNNRLTFMINDLEVYSRQIEGATEAINRYSFTSSGQGRATLSGITTRTVDKSTVVSYVAQDIDATLLGSPVDTVRQLESLLAGRPYDVKNVNDVARIMSAVVSSKELFTKEQREAIAGIINDVIYEPVIQEPAQSSILRQLTALRGELVDGRNRAISISLEDLVKAYGTQVDTIMALVPEDPARRLFMKKIGSLVAWPEEFPVSLANAINTQILRLDEGQTPLLEHDSLDTQDSMAREEATVIGMLQLRTSAERLKDPNFILQLMSETPSLTIRIEQLAELLALHQLNSRDASQGVKLNTTQKVHFLNRVDAIINDREYISNKTDLLDLIKELRVTPGFASGTYQTETYNRDETSPLPEIAALKETDYAARIEKMDEIAQTDISFSIRIEKLTKMMPKIASKPATDAERIKFFIGLATILDAPGVKGEEEIALLEKNILDELEDRPLSKGTGGEAELVAFIRQQSKNMATTTDLFAQSTEYTYILSNLSRLDVPNQLTHLQRTLNMFKDETAPTPLATADRQPLFDAIGNVWENRDELDASQLVALETLLGTIAETPGLSDVAETLTYVSSYQRTLPLNQRTPQTLIDMMSSVSEPVPFDRQVTKLTSSVSEMRLLPRGSVEREQFVARLVNTLELPGNKTGELLTKLQAAVTSMGMINSSEQEKVMLSALEQAITQLTDVTDLFSRYDDNNLIIDNIETLEDRHSRLVHIEKLLRLQIQNRDDDIVQSRRQELFDMIGRIFDERYELADTGKLEAVLLTGNSTPGFAGTRSNPLYYQSRHHGNQDTTGLLTILKEQPQLSFDIQLKSLTSIAEQIRFLPTTAFARKQFFAKLSRLFNASGSRSNKSLFALIDMTETLLEQANLDPQERSIVVDANSQANAVSQTTDYASRTSSPVELLTLLAEETNHEVRVDELQKLVDKQINEQDSDIISAVKNQLTSMISTIVNHHDEMLDRGVTKLRSLLRTLRRTPFINVQSLFFNGRSLEDLEKILDEGIPFSRRLTKLHDRLSSIQTLPDTDSTRQEYMRQLNVLLDAPGPKDEQALATLRDDIIAPLLASLGQEANERAQLEAIVARIEEFSTYNDPLSISNDPGFLVSILDQVSNTARRLATILWILKEQQNNAARNILVLDGKDQRDALINTLTSLVTRRYLLEGGMAIGSPLSLKAQLRDILREVNGTPHLESYRAKIVELINTLDGEGVDFSEVMNHLRTHVSGASKQEAHGPFFTIFSTIMSAPGNKSSADLDEIEVLITNLRQDPLTDAHDAIINKVEEELTLARATNESFKSHLALAQATQATLSGLATELKKMLTAKASSVMFAADDFALFIEQLNYLVNNRELLITPEDLVASQEEVKTEPIMPDPGQVSEVADLLQTTRLNADFGMFVDQLNALHNELKTQTDHSFEDRLTYTLAELERFKEPTTTSSPYKLDEQNHYWRRYLQKLHLILGAPGTKTEDQFRILESSILQWLASNKDVSDADREAVTAILETVISEKAAIIKLQKTFDYHFELALAQKDNKDALITALERIMKGSLPRNADGSENFERIKFGFGDKEEFVALLEKLAEEHDAIDQDSSKQLLASILTDATFSPDFKDDFTLVDRLKVASRALETPKPFADRVAAYLIEFEEKQIMYQSHSERHAFFTKLERLKETPEDERDEAALRLLKKDLFDPDAPDGLLDILKRIKTDDRETRIIAELEALTTKAVAENRTAEYQLSRINREYEELFMFAQEILKVMRGKGTIYSFTSNDDNSMVAALAHVVFNRRLLSSEEKPEQLKEIQDGLRRVIRSGKFTSIKGTLDSLATKLGTVQDFITTIKDATEELKRFLVRPKTATGRNIKEDDWQQLLRKRLASNRMKRLIKLVTTITKAPGSKEDPEDEMRYFDKLDNLLDELAMLPLPHTQAAQVQALIDELTLDKKLDLIEESRRFIHHLKEARKYEEEGNLSLYVSSLHTLIKDHRLGRVTLTNEDFSTFRDVLTVLSEDLDAMSADDRKLFGNAANFSRFSPACPDALKEAFKAIEALSQTVPEFNTALVNKYAQIVIDMMSLKPGEYRRERGFKKLINLAQFTEYKSLDALIDFEERVIDQLRQMPKSGDEEELFTTIEQNHEQDMQQAGQLSYNLDMLLRTVTDQQDDTAVNHVETFIDGMSDIVLKRNDQLIRFNTTDYKRVVDECEKWLVDDRELLDSELQGEAQALFTLLQYGTGFEGQRSRIEGDTGLHALVAQPYLFTERVAKYKRLLSQVSSSPKDDPVREKFAIMISTIFDADGDRSKKDLNALRVITTSVLNGSFSTSQKEFYVRPVANMIDEEYRKLNSFSYRFERIQNAASPERYHSEVERLLNGHVPGSDDPDNLTITANDYQTLLNTLEEELQWRPIVGSAGSLERAINATKRLLEQSTQPGNTPIAGAVTMISKLNNMLSDLAQPVDPQARADQFTQNVTQMLNEESTSGERNRFFNRMETFRQNLMKLSDTQKTNTALASALNEASRTIDSYTSSGLATGGEKQTMIALRDQLRAAQVAIEKAAVAAEQATVIQQQVVAAAPVGVNQGNTGMIAPSATQRRNAQPATNNRFFGWRRQPAPLRSAAPASRTLSRRTL